MIGGSCLPQNTPASRKSTTPFSTWVSDLPRVDSNNTTAIRYRGEPAVNLGNPSGLWFPMSCRGDAPPSRLGTRTAIQQPSEGKGDRRASALRPAGWACSAVSTEGHQGPPASPRRIHGEALGKWPQRGVSDAEAAWTRHDSANQRLRNEPGRRPGPGRPRTPAAAAVLPRAGGRCRDKPQRLGRT